jgi:hypothetical protein
LDSKKEGCKADMTLIEIENRIQSQRNKIADMDKELCVARAFLEGLLAGKDLIDKAKRAENLEREKAAASKLRPDGQ